jgi:hypothetical protein
MIFYFTTNQIVKGILTMATRLTTIGEREHKKFSKHQDKANKAADDAARAQRIAAALKNLTGE